MNVITVDEITEDNELITLVTLSRKNRVIYQYTLDFSLGNDYLIIKYIDVKIKGHNYFSKIMNRILFINDWTRYYNILIKLPNDYWMVDNILSYGFKKVYNVDQKDSYYLKLPTL